MSTEHLGDMRTEYSKSLVAVGEEDPNIVVLGADKIGRASCRERV